MLSFFLFLFLFPSSLSLSLPISGPIFFFCPYSRQHSLGSFTIVATVHSHFLFSEVIVTLYPTYIHTYTHTPINIRMRYSFAFTNFKLLCFVLFRFYIVYACMDDIFRHDLVSISQICGAIRLTLILIKRR